jgi:hypothetical protein
MTTETTGDVAISLMQRIFQRRRGARENEEKFEIRNQKFEESEAAPARRTPKNARFSANPSNF